MLDEHSLLDLFQHVQSDGVGIPYFADCILDDKPVYPGLYEGYKIQQVIDAALQSHETGCRVEIAP